MAAKKKATKVKSSARPRRSASKKVAAGLTDEQRKALIRPPTEYETLTERLADTWSTTARALKVTNRSPAELRRLLKRAQKAAEKEQALLRQFEAKLRPLADARLQAGHDVWRAVLDVYGAIRSLSADDLRGQFDFLAETFSRKSAKPAAPPAPAEG